MAVAVAPLAEVTLVVAAPLAEVTLVVAAPVAVHHQGVLAV